MATDWYWIAEGVFLQHTLGSIVATGFIFFGFPKFDTSLPVQGPDMVASFLFIAMSVFAMLGTLLMMKRGSLPRFCKCMLRVDIVMGINVFAAILLGATAGFMIFANQQWLDRTTKYCESSIVQNADQCISNMKKEAYTDFDLAYYSGFVGLGSCVLTFSLIIGLSSWFCCKKRKDKSRTGPVSA